MQLMDRIERRIERVPEAGCWLWTGAHSRGYGYVYNGQKLEQVHRAVYRTLRGPIPPDKFVCHACDVPACCNPAHLYLGTPQDNMNDKVRRGRAKGNNKRGEQKARATHSDETIRQFMLDRKAGMELKTLAAKYGFSWNRVKKLLYGKQHYAWLRAEVGL